VSTFENVKRAKPTFDTGEIANISTWLRFVMFIGLWRSINESSGDVLLIGNACTHLKAEDLTKMRYSKFQILQIFQSGFLIY
jgi:hypothetical protein